MCIPRGNLGITLDDWESTLLDSWFLPGAIASNFDVEVGLGGGNVCG